MIQKSSTFQFLYRRYVCLFKRTKICTVAGKQCNDKIRHIRTESVKFEFVWIFKLVIILQLNHRLHEVLDITSWKHQCRTFSSLWKKYDCWASYFGNIKSLIKSFWQKKNKKNWTAKIWHCWSCVHRVLGKKKNIKSIGCFSQGRNVVSLKWINNHDYFSTRETVSLYHC